MSDNPFAAPNPSEGKSPQTRGKAPGALTAILVICLIMGIMGLLGSCMGGVALGVQNSLQLQGANMGDPAQQAIQEKMQEMQSQQFIPNVIMIGLNFIVAPLLIIGAIGCLSRKAWGHGLLVKGLLVAVFYVVVKTVLTIVIQVATMGSVGEVMQEAMAQQGGAPPQAAEMMGGAMKIGMVVAIVFAVGWALLQLGFYIWSWTYLRKDEVQRYFGVQ
jgi:hypothetical protein